MSNGFDAEVFQNEFLPAGAAQVHAIMTVTAGDETTQAAPKSRTFGMICDVSGSMEGGKIAAAKAAMVTLVKLLPADCDFFVLAGADAARVVCPAGPATSTRKHWAIDAIREIKAVGATYMSKWLLEALSQFTNCPNGLRQALLLTDGQNDQDDAILLDEALTACDGAFQCDCRGIGADWEVQQLRKVAGKLLGTTDIIPSPDQIEGDFHAILDKALAKNVSGVALRLWTPQGASVKYCKEVSPEIVDLSNRVRQVSPQVREYPTGAWAAGESRDFHFSIEVKPGVIGDEVLAGRASLVYTVDGVEQKAAEARILAIWTDDDAKSTRINKIVAHCTGQADLARSIQEGLEARARGDEDKATALLGKAVKIAHDSGNDGTARLLRNVVEVEDAGKGTVRLKSSVAKVDELALDTRSTKTARIARTS